MIRFLELTALTIFASCNLLAAANPIVGWAPPVTLLSLIAFMVFQNYRQQRATNKVLARKDEQIDKNNDRLADLTGKQIRAMERLTDALEDRPCLKKDQRIQQG